MPLREKGKERNERTKWVVVMSEFSPICICLVISLLVSLILLGICMKGFFIECLNSYIQSQTTRKLPLIVANSLTITISILISLICLWFGIPVIAFCADGDEAGPETFFTPKTEEGGHSLSPQEPIPNWVFEVDLPNESPSDTVNDLRQKCAIILESFSKTQPRDPLTWHDIAQRLVLEDKEAGEGATREDFQRLLGELKNPTTSDVYLRVLKALEKHPR